MTLPCASAPAEHPCFRPCNCAWWEPGGSCPLTASTDGSQVHPQALRLEEAEKPFSFLRCLRWGEGAGGHPESKPHTKAKQTKQLITVYSSPRKLLGLGAGGEGCNGSVSLTGSSARAPGRAQGLVSSVGRGRRRGTPGNIPED